MNMMTMYMLTRLDPLCMFFAIACISSSICVIGSVVLAGPDRWKEFRWAIKYSVIALVISTFGTIFVPSTKEMAAIIIVPKIANSTAVQKDVPELYDLGVEWLKDKLTTRNK